MLLDYYGNTAGDSLLYWPGSVVSTFSHRSGSAYGTPWGASNSSGFSKVFPGGVNQSHIFMGIAMQCNTWVGFHTYVTLLGDALATQHLSIILNQNGIEVRRGATNGALLASYAMTPVNNMAYYIEIEATCADAGGICNVRLNGAQVITFTGDTKNAGTTAGFTGATYGQNGNVNGSFSDWYLLNDSGSAPFNTFLGDIRIPKCRPSGAGASAQFTPDTGSNFARVNENPYNAANYVASSTSGHTDTYAMDDLPASVASVLAVKAAVIAKNPDGGLAQVKNVIRRSGVNYLGTIANLGASDGIVSNTWETDPSTGVAWTPAGVNAMESGMQRV